MKTLHFFFIAILFCMYQSVTNAQWQSDMRLTNDPDNSRTSWNSMWCIASSGNTVHVVWYDNRNGVLNDEIYYKRSTNGGISWGADIRLTNNPFPSEMPSISVSGSVVHVFWIDRRDGNHEIYYKRSIDDGSNWGTDTRLSNTSGFSWNPSVALSGSVVHIVWQDYSDGNWEIYYKLSTDGGLNWGADTRLTNNSLPSQNPSVSVSGSIVHIVWYDLRDGNDEIYYKRSTNGGLSWGTDARLTNATADSWYPSVSVSGLAVHTVWLDNRDGNYEIYYKRSTDGGVSWGADNRLTNNPSNSQLPNISVSGSVVHIAWFEDRDGNWEVYYKRSTDVGVNWGADTRLTNSTGDSYGPSVSVSGSTVHVVWQDQRDGNWEIYYKRDPNGNPVSLKNINTELPKQFSLSLNYPNPFNPTTNIRFAIPKTSFVKLVVYDVLGKEIAILVNEELKAGTYNYDWDASAWASGLYFYKLEAGDFAETKKMVLIK